MKKTMLSILAVLLLFFLAGCGASANSGAAPDGTGAANGSANLAASPANQPEAYVITLGHSTTEQSSNQFGSLKFKEYVEEKSGGRITVQIYPNAQLGADREMLEGVQTGQITMMNTGNVAHANFVKEISVLDCPFAFEDNLEARAIFAEPNFLAALSQRYEANGFKFLGMTDQGFRTLTANKAVHIPNDIKGMKIRTVENKYQMAIWKYLGANPTPLAFNELYTALQQGAVDAQENPIELIYTQKFYEQQKYVISTNHIFQATLWVMNLDFFNNLPVELQKIVTESMALAAQETNEYNDENVAGFKQVISDYGAQFIELTTEELTQFKEMAKGVWDMVEADYPEMYAIFASSLEAIKQ